MKINDIRPENLAEGQKVAMANDIKSLLSHKKDFVFVDCPACGSSSAKEKFKKDGFTYNECQMCSTFYTNPRPTPEILNDFIEHSENYEYWSKYIYPQTAEARREKIFVPRVDKVLQFCKGVKKGSLLEVGAGAGFFCEEMNKRGMFKHVVAVEPSKQFAQMCRDRGVETIESPIEEVKEEKFDVIVNFEVIEHLFDPKVFIEHCVKCLKPDGLLILTCPNGQGFDVAELGIHSDTIIYEHLNYFNPKSLTVFFKKYGLEVVQSITPGKLDAELVRQKVLDGTHTLTNPFLQQVLIERWDELGQPFQDFISRNGLSSNMWLVGKNI